VTIDFAASPRSSVGIEWEFLTIDHTSGGPAPVATQMLDQLRADQGKPRVPHHSPVSFAPNDTQPQGADIFSELLTNTIELASHPRLTVAKAAADLAAGLEQITALAESFGADLIAAGTHPFAQAALQPITDSPRYQRLIDQTAWWGHQQMICGLHTHVGIDNRAKVMPILHALSYYMGHLQALSAASPWWGGVDTGYASNRAMVFQQLPTSGLPLPFDDWSEWEAYAESLQRAKIVEQVNEIRWDIRPAPGFGTIEVRVCDSVPSLLEVEALSALTQCLVEDASQALDQGQSQPGLPHWYVKENKFRAARFGLDASVIINQAGEQRPVRDDVADLVDRLQPVAAHLGCLDQLNAIHQILEQGASCQRQQLAAAAKGGDLKAATVHLVDELHAAQPLPPH